MISQHLPRWIFASVSKHFYDNKGDYVLFIEGQNRSGVGLPSEPQYFELRMDGPDVIEVSKDVFRVNIEVNIVCSAAMNDEDFHLIHAMVGHIASKFTTIGVYKLGPVTDPVINDGSLIGCLNLNSRIEIRHFGQIKADVPLMQAWVEASYTNIFTF